MGKTIAVLMGGWSSEREVSLTSGRACAKALRESGYTVREIDLTRDLETLLTQLTPKPDAVFNALHGAGGEDGLIQGVLEILQIPYTHSSPAVSALAMNKQQTKQILRPAGVKSPEGYIVALEDLKAGNVPLKPPYVIKPNREGSSFGVYIIKEGDNRLPQIADEWVYGSDALLEQYIPGREISVAVMGGKGEDARALTVTEIRTGLEFYNYEAKYAAGGSEHLVPAPLAPSVFDKAMKMAVIAHKTLGCTGVSRSDFRYNEQEPGDEGLYFLETNTQPGMTPTSLVPEQAAHTGMGFNELVVWLAERATLHS